MKFYYLFILMGLFLAKLNAQGVSFFGNTYIDSGGNLYVENLPINFQGNLITNENENYGQLVVNNVTINSSNSGFADGFVKSYSIGDFEFPIGDDVVYAPVEFGIQSNQPVTGKYSLGGTPDTSQHIPDLEKISENEFWQLISNSEGELTLRWQQISGIEALTNQDLSKLRMVGWNQSANQWEIIEHEIPVVGDFDLGQLKSLNAVDLNTYTAFTFGRIGEALGLTDFDFNSVQITLNSGKLTAFSKNVPIDEIILYDLTGRQIARYKTINNLEYQTPYSYPKGVYAATVLLKDGTVVRRKLINQ